MLPTKVFIEIIFGEGGERWNLRKYNWETHVWDYIYDVDPLEYVEAEGMEQYETNLWEGGVDIYYRSKA